MSDLVIKEDKYEDLYRDGKTVSDFTFQQIIHHSYNRAKRFNDDELVQRIERRWPELYGTPYFPSIPMPIGVLGGPGQGKTTVVIKAAKNAAAFMGLNFVNSDNVIPGKDDFFFDVVTLGGQLSPSLIKGAMLPEDMTYKNHLGEEVTQRVMNPSLPTNVIKVQLARAAMILLDDAANAHTDVQTAVYDLLKPEKDSPYANALYSYTGNTGDDGAAAKAFNTAIGSRVRLMYMRDEALDFINRIDEAYSNDIAYSYISSLVTGFIDAHPHYLNASPANAKREKTNFACSRTWTQATESFAQVLRPLAYTALNSPEKAKQAEHSVLLNELFQLSQDSLGRDVSNKFKSHMYTVLQDADPIAREILKAGAITQNIKERIKNKFNEGESGQEKSFMYSLAMSMGTLAAEYYTKAVKNNDQAQKLHILTALTVGTFDALPVTPSLPEYCATVVQHFLMSVVTRNKGNLQVGYKDEKTGEIVVCLPLFETIAQAFAKNIRNSRRREVCFCPCRLRDPDRRYRFQLGHLPGEFERLERPQAFSAGDH